MEALKIEILNPKAMQLIKGMQDLNLIKVTNEPVSKLKSYLKKMRKNAESAPSLEEITAFLKIIFNRNEKRLKFGENGKMVVQNKSKKTDQSC
jgi:hypothetical protein